MKTLLAIVCLLPLSVPAFAEECPDSLSGFLQRRGFVEVELSENTAKQFEVEAEINGEPLLLIVDTGASHTIFSRDRIKELGLDLEETQVEFSGIGRTQRLYSTEIKNLRIGGASTGPISIFAADLSHLQKMLRSGGSRAADGLIGADFLTRWSAVLDVKYSTLFLRIR